MKNVLIINGHPKEPISFANKKILEEVKELLKNAEIRNLSDLITPTGFDIKAEQEALVKADVIVFEFPMFWYALPGILKQYIDDVFTHGFAYGTRGTALKGKKLIASLTTGAPAEDYTKDGAVGYSIDDLYHPLKATCDLCGIKFMPIVHSSGMTYLPGISTSEELKAINQRAVAHAKRLAEAIEKA